MGCDLEPYQTLPRNRPSFLSDERYNKKRKVKTIEIDSLEGCEEFIGEDVLKLILSYLFSGFYLAEDARSITLKLPNLNQRTYLRYWFTAQLVCQEWRELTWSMIDHAMYCDWPIRTSAQRGLAQSVNRLLRESKVSPGAENNYALCRAAEEGHTQVVRLLLTDERVDPSAKDNCALRLAAENGHADTVWLLLTDKRVDPSAKENYSLRWAADEGHTDIVRLLLSDKRVDPGVRDHYMIRKASENGHTETVRLMLSHRSVDPTAEDNYALRMAAKNGHTNTVRLLLSDPRINPSAKNHFALRMATSGGHVETVRLLIHRIDPAAGLLAMAEHYRQHGSLRVGCKMRAHHLFVLFSLLSIAEGILRFQKGQQIIYEVEGQLDTTGWSAQTGATTRGAMGKLTSRLIIECMGSVWNDTLYSFTSNLYGTSVSSNDETPQQANDWTKPLGLPVAFFQSNYGKVENILHNLLDDPYLEKIKLGAISALSTHIDRKGNIEIEEKDVIGVHRSQVSISSSGDHILVRKTFDQSQVISFTDERLHRDNVKLKVNAQHLVHPSGYITEGNVDQNVHLLNVNSVPERKRDDEATEMSLSSSGVITMRVNGQPSTKRSDAYVSGLSVDLSLVDGYVQANLFEAARSNLKRVNEREFSVEKLAALLEQMNQIPAGKINHERVAHVMTQMAQHLNGGSEGNFDKIHEVLMDMENVPYAFVDRLFGVLSSVASRSAEKLLIRFGLDSDSRRTVERALVAFHKVKDTSDAAHRRIMKLASHDDDEISSAALLALGTISSRVKNEEMHLTLRQLIQTRSNSNSMASLSSLYAITNSKFFSTQDIIRLNFHLHPDHQVRRHSLHIVRSLATDSEYPYNYSRSAAKSVGGTSAGATFSAQVFVGTNFNCKEKDFDFDLRAQASSSVTLFEKTVPAVDMSADFGQSNGVMHENQAVLKVGGQVVKVVPLDMGSDCQEGSQALQEMNFLGFDVSYTMWVTIIPVKFTASTHFRVDASVHHEYCPMKLTATAYLVPEAAFVLSGSADIDLIIIKTGTRLSGTLDGALVPRLSLWGSECKAGASVEAQNGAMQVDFKSYVQRQKCFLWYFNCKPGPSTEKDWFVWETEPSTQQLWSYNATINTK
ncbi:lipid transport family protein [Planoprotostelium fungivorum]|uniref:Lipid transport family protein n=1 Tax=Planoprotostelium fungivorum TaxID=1890364 RepID=A0A2P6NB26_9EUKA|nr:lipid transport family protein [Planoprotostelium fungivorum]